MVQGNSTKKDVYDVGTKTIYIGEIVIPPGEYKEKLKKEDDEKLKTEGEYD